MSGFNALDNITGGFGRSDLIIVAGRPGMGKTSFALNIARNACVEQNACVAIFSLEMSGEELVTRLISTKPASFRPMSGLVCIRKWTSGKS